MALNTSGPYTEKKTVSDLIRHEYNPAIGYTRKAVKVYNRTGASVTITDIIGWPVKVDGTVSGAYKLAVYGDEANVKGLIISPGQGGAKTIANDAYVMMVILFRGPAIIDKAAIPTADTASATFVLATIVTALEALNPPILCNPEEPVTSTQTT